MSRAPRPKPRPRRLQWAETGLMIAAFGAAPALAQPAGMPAPLAASYAARDGRIMSSAMACVSLDGSFTAQPCGVAGYPLHVTVDGNAGTPQPVTDAATQVLAASVRGNDTATNRLQTHDDQLSAMATAANQAAANGSLASLAGRQPALAADGGALAHVINLPATQPVSNAGLFTVQDSNSAAFQGVVPITPGTPVAAQRSLGYVVTSGGTVTLTLADASSLTLTLAASPAFQTLPFAVTSVTPGAGLAATFWNLK